MRERAIVWEKTKDVERADGGEETWVRERATEQEKTMGGERAIAGEKTK